MPDPPGNDDLLIGAADRGAGDVVELLTDVLAAIRDETEIDVVAPIVVDRIRRFAGWRHGELTFRPGSPAGVERTGVRLVPVRAGGAVAGSLELSGEAAGDDDPAVARLLAVLSEVLGGVADRQAASALLAAERTGWDRAQAAAHVGLWSLDLSTNEVVWSSEVHRMTGHDPATELSATSVLALVHADDLPIALGLLDELRLGHVASSSSCRFVRPSGEVRWLEVQTDAVRHGRASGFCFDITERRAEEDERRMHTQILDTMNEGVAVVPLGAGGVGFMYVNPRYAHDLGCSREEVMARSTSDFFGGEQAGLGDSIRAGLTRDRRWEGDVQVVRPDGSGFTNHLAASMMELPDRGPVILVIGSDVTDQRAQEMALRDSVEQTRLVQAHSPIGMAMVGLDGRWLEVNEALCTMLGRSRAELERLTARDVTHPDDIDGDEEFRLGLLVSRPVFEQREKRYVHRDGHTVWVIVNISLVLESDGAPRLFIIQVLDISHRKADEDKLREYADDTREANRAKTQFLARMSHELRTPLNAVLGYGQLLAGADLGGDDHESVDHILHAGWHLLGLIDEVLEITQVEAGTLTVTLEAINVSTLIDDAVSLVRPMADSGLITISVAAPVTPTAGSSGGRPGAPGLVAYADRQRTLQVLLNLLSNAVKYNHPGGMVTIGAERVQDEVRFAVTDTGLGIPADAMHRVFEPFDRLGADGLGIQGTGIGLPLSRALAERMDGTLVVTSRFGRGSTFTLALPAAGDATRPVHPVRSERAVTRTDAGTATPGTGALTVVNIEDNPANQHLVAAVLRQRPNVTLLTAPDGQRGLALVDASVPDLVLLDLHLPDADGSDILRILRARPEGIRPVIAVLSADASPELIEAVAALGADHYLTKPLDIAELIKLVDDVAASRR